MNDAETRKQAASELTIRRADAADQDALERIATLDGRQLGASPLLVAEADGALVAALSTIDGSVVADPFRFTLEAIALLRAHPDARDTTARSGIRGGGSPVSRSLMRAAAIVTAAVASITIAASGAQAAAQPGLPPGTWVGSGSASGTDVQSGLSSRFTATLSFRIVVSPSGRVTGTGAFASDMTVTGEYPSVISSQADVRFSGTPTRLVYAGTARTRGTFDAVTRTLKPIALRQQLPISRAGSCRASGSFLLNGVSFRWTAARKVAGQCRS